MKNMTTKFPRCLFCHKPVIGEGVYGMNGVFHPDCISETKKTPKKWSQCLGRRLLVTDKMTDVSRSEWTLLEISPSGQCGKFKNEIIGNTFWEDLEGHEILEILPASIQKDPESVLDPQTEGWVKVIRGTKDNPLSKDLVPEPIQEVQP